MWRQCFLISFVLCQIQRRDAYRSSADEPATLKVQETGLEKDCSTKASLSPDSFDESSLIIEDPDFTFLDSREFFLSPKPSCDVKLEDLKLRSVPSSTEAKRQQQERRFKVKMIKEGLASMKKQESEYARGLVQQFRSQNFEEIPAMELHMLPEDPLDISSKWLALLVPKAQGLFGRTVYLCRPVVSQEEPEPELPCVAELKIPPLPGRLMNLFNDWDSVLDPLKSVPHGLVLGLEIILFAGIVLMSCKAAFLLLRLGLLHLRGDTKPQREERLLSEPLPRPYKLLHSAKVHKDASPLAPAVIDLDTGDAVTVVEVKRCNGNVKGSLLVRLLNSAKSLFRREPFSAVWGWLEEPAGWLLLYDAATGWEGVLGPDDRAPFKANQQLLVPVGELLRRELVLATSHSTVQWLLLNQLACNMQVALFVALAISLFAMHMLVLLQAESTVKWGVQCDQVLAQDRKRLRPDRSRSVHYFAVILAVMLCALLFGLKAYTSILTPCLVLALAILVHAWDLNCSLTGLSNWRELQLTSEFAEYPGEKLLSSTERPVALTLPRERHYLIVSLLTWLVATAALSVLILLGLDGLQMRGSLLEYSFSKGHVVYLPGVTALNNTLLLHDDVDSVTFGFEAGVHTKTITLRLEHPQMQLNDSEKVVLFSHRADSKLAVPAGEYPLNLPAGPLYARIIVEAESRLKIPPTQYTFHVLRVGEALALSLSGEVATPQEDAPGRRVPFQESRRWLYQQRHAEWYVPKLEENSSVSLQVELRPICFAPLKRAQHERRSHFSSYSEECLCGDEVAGLGTNCILEKKIPLNSTPVCLFLHDTTDRMRMDDSKGSLSGTDRKLVKWLQDVRISGRFAGLRSDPSLTELEAQNLQNSTTSDEEPVVWPLEVVNSSEFQISRFFRITKPAALLMQASQLLVATTPDDTDAEEQALPLKIVPHPPPVYLNVSGGMGMLLPEFSMNNRRSGYVICAVRDLTAVHGSTLDARFHVEEDVVRLSRDCSGELVEQKRFRAVRNDSCEYWDRYEPWSDNFDVAVTLSPEACLNEAIDLDIASAWKDAGFSHWSENMAKHHRKSCSALQRAVRLERVDVLPELLKHWDVNCDGCKETPLGAAASEGRMRSLKLLLHTPKVNLNVADEDGGTPLLRAAQHCQVAAVERLLENGSDVNALAPRRPRSKCLLTPLLWIAGHDACHEKQDSAAPMAGDASGNLSSLLTILAKGANHSTPAHDGCGQQTSLVEAINNIALPVVPLLLDLGASANEPGVMGPTDMDVGRPLAVLLSKFLQEKVGWDAFVAAFDLLLSKDANVNGLAVKDGSTVLIQAAKRCRPDVIKFLLKKGADPTIQAGQKKKRTAEDWAARRKGACSRDANATDETLRLLREEVIKPKQ